MTMMKNQKRLWIICLQQISSNFFSLQLFLCKIVNCIERKIKNEHILNDTYHELHKIDIMTGVFLSLIVYILFTISFLYSTGYKS